MMTQGFQVLANLENLTNVILFHIAQQEDTIIYDLEKSPRTPASCSMRRPYKPGCSTTWKRRRSNCESYTALCTLKPPWGWSS